ncbi:MAG TPA: lipocalin-like domain-containing protein [Candidatus Nitrosotalea sp.]|nr:lipocalin-like domain-containing protein [Candidatus Nitrosotalea sp.]
MESSHSVSRKNVLQIATSFGLLAAVRNVAPADASEGVVGAWSLVSFDVDEGKSSEKPRFGPNPVGYLIYSADARMAAVLAGVHRSELTPNSPPCHTVSPRAVTPSASSRAESRDGYDNPLLNSLAYAGRYEIKGDRVFHHVEVSVFTNLIGTTLERQFKLKGDTLTIRTLPPEIWGSSNVLVWKRA